MQDSNFREVRVTNLLLKIKRHQRKTEDLENTVALHYVPKSKWLAMNSENLAEIYIIEITKVSLFWVAK
jgi:hypothetical protein